MSDAGLKTFLRGLDLVEATALSGPDGMSLEEIAEATGQPRSTAYRLLKALRDAGLMRQVRRGRYRPGYRLIRLAAGALHGDLLAAAARPALHDLVAQTGETAFIAVRAGADALCLEKIESPRSVRVAYTAGRVVPLYAGASAKVLLAFAPERDRQRVLAGPFQVFTDPAFVTRERIAADLARITREGHAVSRGETDPGATAVSVPVLAPDQPGQCLASVTVVGPDDRMTDAAVETARQAAVAAAERIAVRYRDGTT